MAAASLARIGSGVPFGSMTASQTAASNPARPSASATVGTSGTNG